MFLAYYQKFQRGIKETPPKISVFNNFYGFGYAVTIVLMY
jgi:hypothetical protein